MFGFCGYYVSYNCIVSKGKEMLEIRIFLEDKVDSQDSGHDVLRDFWWSRVEVTGGLNVLGWTLRRCVK